MRKLKSIDKFLIAALVLFSIMFCSSAFSQGLGVIDDNPNIYGEWKSMDGEHTLYMNYLEEYDLDNFVRISPDGVHTGTFHIRDKVLLISKEDPKQSYYLEFQLKGLNLIVMKPNSEKSEGQAWFFKKVSNNQTEY
mgnify:CR=1 FL=1